MKNVHTAAKGLFIFLAIIFSAASVQSYTAEINDAYDHSGAYYGGRTPGSYGDVVGNVQDFEISKLIYTTNNGHNTIQIVGNYFSTTDTGREGTVMGDLFISTNGWNPSGTAPNYLTDTMSTGEKWELAVSLDRNDFTGSNTGNLSLYALTGATNGNNIKPSYYSNSNNETNIDWYRSGQAFIHKDTITGTNIGTWTIVGNTLTFNFDYDFSAYPDLGFHWGMSCGNDVIEGGVHVPEPGTMLLLGFGLVSLVGMGRLRKK